MEASSTSEAPFGEIHLHLRGACPKATLAHLLTAISPQEALRDSPERHLRFFESSQNTRLILQQLSEDLPPSLDQLFSYTKLEDFFAAYLLTGYFVKSADQFREMAQAAVDGLHTAGYEFAEITVSIPEYLLQGLPLDTILETLDEIRSNSPLSLLWIVDPVRNLGEDAALSLLQQIHEIQPGIIEAVTLGGNEAIAPPEQFSRLFNTARDSGLRTTIHSGEMLGPESIRFAWKELGVERIGHGVRAVEDLSLVDELARAQLPLEVCISSNLVTSIYPNLEAHPVKTLLERGVNITLNTDDPTFFHTTLEREYALLRSLGCSQEQIAAVRRNTAQARFL